MRFRAGGIMDYACSVALLADELHPALCDNFRHFSRLLCDLRY